MKNIASKILENASRGSLYALSRGDDLRVKTRRIETVQSLQDDLRGEFARQVEAMSDDSTEIIPYVPFQKIDDNELFSIEVSISSDRRERTVVLPDELVEATRTSEDSRTLASREIGPDVRALAWVVEASDLKDAIVAFQVFEHAQVIDRRSPMALAFFDNVYQRLSSPALSLRDRVDAVMHNGCIIFRSDYYLQRYLDISDIRLAASQSGVDAFFACGLFKHNGALRVHDSDLWIRKKIASITNRYGDLSIINLDLAQDAAVTFGVSVGFVEHEGKKLLELPTDKKEFKRLLRFLDDDLYTSWQGANYQAAGKRIFNK